MIATNHWKTSARLGLGFGLVIALLAALMLTSLSRMSALGANVEDLASSRVPKLVLSARMVETLLQSARQMRNVLILDHESQIRTEVGDLIRNTDRVKELAGRVAALLTDEAEKAGKFLADIVPATRKTSDLVQEIAAASQEQSSSVAQINTSMTQLSQITQQNASSSEELAATAEEMSSQAQGLQELIGFFKVDAADAPAGAMLPVAARRLAGAPALAAPGADVFTRFQEQQP